MIASARHARSGVESTYLARPLRVVHDEQPLGFKGAFSRDPRLCPYCDAPGASDHLTCGSAECLGRYDAFTAAMTKVLEGIP